MSLVELTNSNYNSIIEPKIVLKKHINSFVVNSINILKQVSQIEVEIKDNEKKIRLYQLIKPMLKCRCIDVDALRQKNEDLDRSLDDSRALVRWHPDNPGHPCIPYSLIKTRLKEFRIMQDSTYQVIITSHLENLSKDTYQSILKEGYESPFKFTLITTILSTKSFIKSFNLTIDIYREANKVLQSVGLPYVVLDNILLGYLME